MEKKVYQEIAGRIKAMENCEESGNLIWREKHKDVITHIQDNYLPSGSGIDSGCVIDPINAAGNYSYETLTICSSFHTMNENGMYGRWIEFRIIVKPSLQFGFTLRIAGNFGKDQYLKDYLLDVFNSYLDKTINLVND